MQSIREYSPLALAFYGDSVYDMLVRRHLLTQANRQAAKLHQQKIQLVCAAAQAKAATQILPLLTEEELSVYKRGRNAHNTVPRHTAAKDYHMATGLEALFGYLSLQGSQQRLEALFEEIIRHESGHNENKF